MEFLTTFAAFLASAVAVAAALAGVTKGTRLRRREQFLRELLPTFDSRASHHATVVEIHRAVVSELLIRQLFGVWRFVWPVAMWVAVGVAFAQTGYLSARYIADRKDGVEFDLMDYMYAVTGGGLEVPMFLIAFLFLLSPFVFARLSSCVVQRAMAVVHFNRCGIARTPDGIIRAVPSVELWPDGSGGYKARNIIKLLSIWLKLWGPGFLSVSSGFVAGSLVATRRNVAEFATSDPGGGISVTLLVAALMFAVGMSLTSVALVELRAELRKYVVPRVNPRTGVVLRLRP